MYPKLQNGDLVFYKATDTAHITNGTIIVFVQGSTSEPLLDGLVRPILIHRIVGEEIQSDGTVLYQTKGDNNQENDPFLTRPDQVLGVVTLVIPKVGLLVLFLQSTQGLIAAIGIISLTYVGMVDMKRREEKKRDQFLGALSKKVLSGDLSNEQFEKIELVLKYSDDIETSDLDDPTVLALVNWLKNGGLDQNWKIKTIICTECSGNAIELEGEKNSSLIICSKCYEKRARNKKMDLTEKETNGLSLLSSNEVLSS
jgi:signal peptidase I